MGCMSYRRRFIRLAYMIGAGSLTMTVCLLETEKLGAAHPTKLDASAEPNGCWIPWTLYVATAVESTLQRLRICHFRMAEAATDPYIWKKEAGSQVSKHPLEGATHMDVGSFPICSSLLETHRHSRRPLSSFILNLTKLKVKKNFDRAHGSVGSRYI